MDIRFRQRQAGLGELAVFTGEELRPAPASADLARFEHEDVPHVDIVEPVRPEPAHLEDDRDAVEIVDRDERVGHLPLVLVLESPARADDGSRELRPGRQHPVAHVHLMHALVADVPVAEIPEPVPAVGDQVGVIGLPGRGAEP